MVVEAISTLGNQVAYPAAHHLGEKLEILPPVELEEGNDHGTSEIWIIPEKQTEERSEKSGDTKKGVSIPRENPGGASETLHRGITPASHVTCPQDIKTRIIQR